MKKFMDKTNYV